MQRPDFFDAVEDCVLFFLPFALAPANAIICK